jgi:chromosome segregation ATPase
VQNRNQAVAETNHGHRSKLSILAQKQTRVDGQAERVAKEITELERGTASMHTEMSKINTLLAEHTEKQQVLADDNFVMEHEFVTRLKEMEADAVQMELQIVALKEQKEGLLLDVTEAEKQVMLLEKKIALERETQAALDPEVGAAEVRAMEREIHRMRLRYAQLQRRQEQMIAEMERAIYKRDNIEAKGKVLVGKKGAPPTHAALSKAVSELTKKLQMTTHDANVTQLSVLKLRETQAAKGAEVEGKAQEVRDMQQSVGAAEAMLISQQQLQAVQEAQLRTQSKLARKLVDAAQGQYQPHSSAEALKARIAEADDTSARLLSVVDALSNEVPHLGPALSSMVQAISAP